MAGIFLRTGYPFFFQLVLRQSLGLEENSMIDQQREEIRTMRLQGAGYIKIGKALGISDNMVRSFYRRNGLGENAKNALSCRQCGKLIKIIPKQKPKKFCSDKCRNAWWNEHQECITRKAVYEYTCSCCGKPLLLMPVFPTARTLCSTHFLRRSAITATSFRTTAIGSMRVYIPMKPRQAQKTQEQVFRA